MLNRRYLRIRVMQSIYALKQNEKANFYLGITQIEEKLHPYLNSTQKGDIQKIKEKLKKTKEIFQAIVLEKKKLKTIALDVEAKEALEIATNKFKEYCEKDKAFFHDRMLQTVESVIENYFSQLCFLLKIKEIANFFDSKTENSNYKNLIYNRLLMQIEKNATSKLETEKKLWENYQNEIKSWFKKEVAKDKDIQDYFIKDHPTFEEDKTILLHILKKLIYQKDSINALFEEKDIYWPENKKAVKYMVTKTIKNIKDHNKEVLFFSEPTNNWEDDKEFFENLYIFTLQNMEEYEQIVSNLAHNWKIERIAVLDRIILCMGISEAINFSSIPIKVTLNEYLELAKQYCTPKSQVFINGILDKSIKLLNKQGKIKKSGRGIIDNK